MWTKRLGLVLILFVAGIVFLFRPDRDAQGRVLADAPAAQPQGSQFVFLPFIANNYVDPLKQDPLWRFGVDPTRQSFSTYNCFAVAHLRLGWFVDFDVTANPATFGSMEYVPMVRVKQWKQLPDGTPTLCCVGCSYLAPPPTRSNRV